MKTIEEKAKAYDEALEDMRVIYPNLKGDVKLAVEHAFPELRESEDEIHRKWILEYLYDGLRKADEQFKHHFKSAIDWLEKQKEPHIPWYDYQKSKEAGYTIVPNEEYEQLIKQKEQKPAVSREEILHQLFQNGSITLSDYLYLTEEQKPVVTHGETYHVDTLGTQQVIAGKMPQKPAEWSEKDKYILKNIRDFVKENTIIPNRINCAEECLKWINALPERFNLRPKQEWSEEDEKMRNLAIEWAETMSGQFSFVDMDSTDFRKIITWLKSLRPQPHWKPSERQLTKLYCIARGIPDGDDSKVLMELYENLKRL